MKPYLLAASIILLFASCRSEHDATIKRRSVFYNKWTGKLEPTLFTATMDATKRLSIIRVDSTGKFTTFSENPPDAVLQTAIGIVANFSEKESVSAEAKLDLAKAIVQLGKRSEAISFQRDQMFRISELYTNGAIKGTQIITLMDSLQLRTLRMSRANSKAEVESLRLEKLKEVREIISEVDSTKTFTQSQIMKMLEKI